MRPTAACLHCMSPVQMPAITACPTSPALTAVALTRRPFCSGVHDCERQGEESRNHVWVILQLQLKILQWRLARSLEMHDSDECVSDVEPPMGLTHVLTVAAPSSAPSTRTDMCEHVSPPTIGIFPHPYIAQAHCRHP
jgi:hypothetical protein